MTGKQSIRDLPPGRALNHQEPDEIKIGDTGKISVEVLGTAETQPRNRRRASSNDPLEMTAAPAGATDRDRVNV
jgi:hypothetical protein